jgi:hypothetical protein
MEQELRRIFRLLKLVSARDLHSAYVGVQSTQRMVHNALEFWRTSCRPNCERNSTLLDSAHRRPTERRWRTGC